MFDQLGFPPAKRTLYRHYNRDKHQLLDLLMAEAEGEITDYQPAPQEARQPSRRALRTLGPHLQRHRLDWGGGCSSVRQPFQIGVF